MADFRLGRLKFKWRGDWAATTAYVIDDIVKYGANAYVCTTNHTASAAETSFYSADLGNWDLHTEGLRNRGMYNNTGYWYTLNDLVKYGNSVYRCTTAHTGPASFDFTKFEVYSEGLNFENSWSSATLYQKGDIVTFGGYTYISQQNSTNIAPNTDEAYWKVLSTGFSPQGDYNSAEVYEPGNLVKYGGNSYSCKVTTSTENYSIDTISADGTTGTLVFTTSQPAAPFGVGDEVTISGASIVDFNTTFRVATCSTAGFTFATALTSNASGGSAAYIPVPSNTRFWDLVIEGLNFTGAWNNTAVYQLGDVVNRNGNSYVCITLNTTGAATAPELDTNADYWNYLSQGGDAAQVLQETGDLLYQSASGINRIALPANVSTATAAELREASGKVLTVGGSPILPRWESNNTSAQVYYIAKEGSDSNSGRSISRAFATVRYACDFISALTGSEKPSSTNPVTIYIKAGVYQEILPIFVPPHCSIVGDNLRNSIIKPKSGFNSTSQTLILATGLAEFQYGDVVANESGSKTAEILEYVSTTRTLTINQRTGSSWTSADKWINTLSNSSADAGALLKSNQNFLAENAYGLYARDIGNVPSGVAATVVANLEDYVDRLAFNVRAGGNNKIHELVDALLQSTDSITGVLAEDKVLIQYIGNDAKKVINNETVDNLAATATQTKDNSITVDAGGCATIKSAIGTLTDLAFNSIDLGSMQSGINYDAYLSITTATGIVNQETTMFFIGTHTILKDIVMEGMSGFIPYATNDKDVDHATLKGVYLRLNANSPITKSPYIQNCAAIGGAAVGVVLDGGVHERYDNTATRSNKSMVFDSYTQILDDGVGFYITRAAASEIVSCFTYYNHISYTSTRGGRIRGVSGNSSYGKYGAIARGFDANEVTVDGKVKGGRLEINPAGAKDGGYTPGERIIGGTSGAVGELISDQSPSGYLYYFPVTGTFVQGEVITGQLSSAYVTLVNNTDAVTGQKGFVLTVVNLAAGPDQGGSVELQDNGSNNDSGSYVISNASYVAPDGRGSLTVNRGALGSSASTHNGTTGIAHYKENVNGESTSLTGAINSTSTGTEASPYIMGVDSVAGMVATGYVVVNQELFKVVSISGAQQIEVARAQDGTVAQNHAQGDGVTIYQPKVASNDAAADELIEDVNNSQLFLRVAKSNISFESNDYVKVDNEFFLISAVTTDTTGITTLLFADEKVVAAGDGQDFKIRYRYSQVRLTAHDFLDVGTGNKANTNWPGLPNSPNVPSQETDEARPGRVYYVSTDQDGNFAVGKYFRVEQATGKATLDASAFDLSGLSSLRLGSIGAQLGAAINEFSTDGTMAQNSNEKVPTQAAVVTFVKNLTGVDSDFSVGGNLTVTGTTTTISSVTVQAKDRNIELGIVSTGSFTGDINAGEADITNVSDTTNLAPGVQVSLTSGGGTVTMSGAYTVQSISGTTVTLSGVFQGSGSATGTVFGAGGATDTTADGGGITLKSSVDRTISWQASNSAWKLSEHADLADGKAYMIDGTTVLSETSVLGCTIATDFDSVTDSAIPTVEAVTEQIDAQVSASSYFLSLN
jgi:hypothetical protein